MIKGNVVKLIDHNFISSVSSTYPILAIYEISIENVVTVVAELNVISVDKSAL